MESTKRNRARRKLFADLKIGIYRGKKLVRVATIPDPRNHYCKSFNEFFPEDGERAKPLPRKGGAA